MWFSCLTSCWTPGAPGISSLGLLLLQLHRQGQIRVRAVPGGCKQQTLVRGQHDAAMQPDQKSAQAQVRGARSISSEVQTTTWTTTVLICSQPCAA